MAIRMPNPERARTPCLGTGDLRTCASGSRVLAAAMGAYPPLVVRACRPLVTDGGPAFKYVCTIINSDAILVKRITNEPCTSPKPIGRISHVSDAPCDLGKGLFLFHGGR